MLDWLFGCDHLWFNFSGKGSEITFFNGIDITFTITPQVCLKCKKVQLKYVEGNL